MAAARHFLSSIKTTNKTAIICALDCFRPKDIHRNSSKDVFFTANGSWGIKDVILRHTEATNKNHLTPELKLNLLTEKCDLWTANLDQCPFDDPYWAFYWPGGQALTRYILDNSDWVRGRRVIDVGSGCGAAAIAAAMRGAALATANDIDEVAACAISHNAEINGVSVDINTSDIIGTNCSLWDTILVGDMFYDTDFSEQIVTWLQALYSNGKTILIGDPGRHTFQNSPAMSKLRLLKSYDLTAVCMEENWGLHTGHVWIWEEQLT